MEYKLEVKKPATGTLLMLVSYATVSAVLFAPGIPEMRDFFKVSNSLIQLPVIVFLLFYALSQLVCGPLANSLGRKKTIYIGMAVGVAGSLLCALSGWCNSFPLLVAGRCIAALGSGAGLALTFTIINDYFYPEQALKITSFASIAFAISPGVSATVGGFMVTHYGWPSCFWFLTIYGLVILLFCMALPETAVNKERIDLGKTVKTYRKTAANRKLIYFSAKLGATTAMLYVFASVGPLIVINLLKINADIYGLLNLILTAGLIFGNIIVLNIHKKTTPHKLVRSGIAVLVTGILLLLALFVAHVINVYSIFLPGFIIFAGIALVYSSAATLATSEVDDKAQASSVMCFFNVGLGCAGMVLTAVLPFESETVMPLSLLAFLAVMLLVYAASNKMERDLINMK